FSKAVDKVIPELNWKLTNTVFCVPMPSVPTIDLTCHLEKAATYGDVKEVVKQAFEGPLKGILGYIEDHIFSCNCNSDTHSSTFDAGAGITLIDNSVKVISWYNNTYDFNNKVVDLIGLHGLQGLRSLIKTLEQ
ncbi:glyceraldehyde-3-phosphate dehydrogenase, partial [Sigmodon hispidus]